LAPEQQRTLRLSVNRLAEKGEWDIDDLRIQLEELTLLDSSHLQTGFSLLDLTNRGDFVLDPFLGSGSTVIAAEQTGRTCLGFELDPLYVDVIARRFQEFTGQEAIHMPSGVSFSRLAETASHHANDHARGVKKT
jgi:hypothetical protein